MGGGSLNPEGNGGHRPLVASRNRHAMNVGVLEGGKALDYLWGRGSEGDFRGKDNGFHARYFHHVRPPLEKTRRLCKGGKHVPLGITQPGTPVIRLYILFRRLVDWLVTKTGHKVRDLEMFIYCDRKKWVQPLTAEVPYFFPLAGQKLRSRLLFWS